MVTRHQERSGWGGTAVAAKNRVTTDVVGSAHGASSAPRNKNRAAKCDCASQSTGARDNGGGLLTVKQALL